MDRCQLRNQVGFCYGAALLWMCWFPARIPLQGQETTQPASIGEIQRLKQQELAALQNLVRDCPARLGPQILLARVLYRHGRDTEAVRRWKAILRQHPQRTDVCDLLGMTAFKKGKYEQAIAYWQKALQVNPKLPQAHSSIARALTALGRQEQAIAAFQKEIEISPQSAQDHFLLAQQLLQQNQAAQAKQYYRRAIALNPRLVNAYYGLFQAHSRLQEAEQARQCLQTFKQLNTQKQQARTQSILAFDDLTKAKRDAAQTYAQVGKTYLLKRMLVKAEAPLKQAVALCPDRQDYGQLLAICRRARDNLRKGGIRP